MKTTFNMEVEIKDKDILEEEVIKAMQGFAKNTARDAFEDVFRTELERLINNRLEQLKEKSWFSKTNTYDDILKNCVYKYVDETMEKFDIDSKIQELLEKQLEIINEYTIKEKIELEIKRQVPEFVLDCIRKTMWGDTNDETN